MSSLVLLAAAPLLARRFVEATVEPRAMVWVYFALLASLFVAVMGLAVFLFLFLAPHPLMAGLGTACVIGDLCLHALPAWAQFTMWLSVTGLVGWLLFRMGWTGVAALRAGRRVRRALLLRATPIETVKPYPVYEVADRSVFACTIGIRRPIMVVSQGLRESLPEDELAVVLAHEEAHAFGRDNLILLVARMVGSALFFLPSANWASRGVQRSVEISADAYASRGTGDRLLVAGSVDRVARLLFESTRPRTVAAHPVAAAFAHGEFAVERVERLVKDGRPAASRRRLLCGAVAVAFILVMFAGSLFTVAGNTLIGDTRSAVCVDSVFTLD